MSPIPKSVTEHHCITALQVLTAQNDLSCVRAAHILEGFVCVCVWVGDDGGSGVFARTLVGGYGLGW